MAATGTYTIAIRWPVGQYRYLQDTLTFRAKQFPDLSKSVSGGISPWERFESHLRSRHRETFDAMVDPISGQPWTPLTPKYAATKPPGTQNRILYRTGLLRKALTTPKGVGHISIRRPRSLEWGVGGIGVYPSVHQRTARTRKDGQPLRRPFLGIKLPDDMVILARIIRSELVAIRLKARQGKGAV